MRRRLSVALVVAGCAGTEIDGLRRALGCPKRVTQPPHITLVPPVNVPEEALASALSVVRRAAATTDSFTVTIGPVATFAPRSPVLYLEVNNRDVFGLRSPLERMHTLQAVLATGALTRPTDHDFVPHVTVCANAPPELVDAGLRALRSFVVDVDFDRLTVLEWVTEPDSGRVWRPVADIALGDPVVRGRGGIELTFRLSHLLAPDTADALVAPLDRFATAESHRGSPLVLEVRVHDVPVAAAVAFTAGPIWQLSWLSVAPSWRRMGVAMRLLDELAAVADREAMVELRVPAPAAWMRTWLLARGWHGVADTDEALVRRSPSWPSWPSWPPLSH